jgi:hypothetical protein
MSSGRGKLIVNGVIGMYLYLQRLLFLLWMAVRVNAMLTNLRTTTSLSSFLSHSFEKNSPWRKNCNQCRYLLQATKDNAKLMISNWLSTWTRSIRSRLNCSKQNSIGVANVFPKQRQHYQQQQHQLQPQQQYHREQNQLRALRMNVLLETKLCKLVWNVATMVWVRLREYPWTQGLNHCLEEPILHDQ